MNSSNLCDVSQEWDSGMYPSTRTKTRTEGDENTQKIKKRRRKSSKQKIVLIRPPRQHQEEDENDGLGSDEEDVDVVNSLAGDQRPHKQKNRLSSLPVQMIPPPTKQQSLDYHHQQQQKQLHKQVKEELDQTIHLVETIDVMEAEIEKLQRQIKMQQEHIDDWKGLATMNTPTTTSLPQSNLVTLVDEGVGINKSDQVMSLKFHHQRPSEISTFYPSSSSYSFLRRKSEIEKEKEKEVGSSGGLSFSAKCVIGVGISTILLLGFIFICFKITKLCSKIEKRLSLEERKSYLSPQPPPIVNPSYPYPSSSHPYYSYPPPPSHPPPQYYYPLSPYTYPFHCTPPSQGYFPSQFQQPQQPRHPKIKRRNVASQQRSFPKFNQPFTQPKTTLGRKMPFLDDFI